MEANVLEEHEAVQCLSMHMRLSLVERLLDCFDAKSKPYINCRLRPRRFYLSFSSRCDGWTADAARQVPDEGS